MRRDFRLRKQLSRSEKKRKDKKKIKAKPKNIESKVSYKVPNIKDVPHGCTHLVNKGDAVYVVPGDGACFPNCASAFLFQDEVFGPNLRKAMNRFFVKHWYRKYQHICPCSKDTPFVRNTSKGPVKYTDPEELFKYLLSDDEKTIYMWSDSVDMTIIADMYQINIKTITIKSSSDSNPTVNWVHADKNMEKFAELKNVEQDNLVLLHEDESHFNLIVAQDSDLARLGSLSYRFNVGPMINKDEDAEEVIDIEQEVDEPDLKTLKKELRKCKEDKKKLHSEYINCEAELRRKTEEAEILKTEIKDLKELMKLETLLSEEDENIPEKEVKCSSSDEENLLKMKKRV